MSVFRLNDEHPEFPPVEMSEGDGLLAVGGKLTPEWLTLAYRSGIFPWFNPGDPVMWWSPDPRLVLFPKNLKVSKSMRPILNQQKFRVRYDTRFSDVIDACSAVHRTGQLGTWITPDMKTAYQQMHELGWAHSVEVFNEDNELVGGLYGIAMGGCFFGESMFALESNASKTGFIHLVRWLDENGFTLIDCQMSTDHLIRMGAEEIPRQQFLSRLKEALKNERPPEKWAYSG